MVHIPDVVAYPLKEAVAILSNNNIKTTIVESYGKSIEKTEDVRVIRQKNLAPNEVELVISFF